MLLVLIINIITYLFIFIIIIISSSSSSTKSNNAERMKKLNAPNIFVNIEKCKNAEIMHSKCHLVSRKLLIKHKFVYVAHI